MKLIEALSHLKEMKERRGGTVTCFLATGFNSLHLRTLVAAELAVAIQDKTVEVLCGIYGDLAQNIDRLKKSEPEIGIVVVEWPDLDPRLGIRSSARRTSLEPSDVLSAVRSRAVQLQQAIGKLPVRSPVVLCLPTLPLPPFSHLPSWQAGEYELELRAIVQSFATNVSHCPQMRLLSAQWIDLVSPLNSRHDIESEIIAGFPYRLPHASALAKGLICLGRPIVPKKGLITDLDETLWRGTLGEDGIEGISWDLENGSQMHAFYQRFLGVLASEGVLIGVATKNEASLVKEALHRRDLALPADALFPVEASWRPKSEALARILKTWNVGPDSVVFVDDSALELAEVKASHPEVECFQFPNSGNARVYELVLRLRDMFGKSAILEEDSIRMESIRRSHMTADVRETGAAPQSSFFDQVEAEISFDFSKTPLEPRALELVNKTNQFNLNGVRHTVDSWHDYLQIPAIILMVISYRDKFGPLGRISVLVGRQDGRRLVVNTWVMSCRAFSRRIEYRCIEELFSRFDLDEIELDYLETDRNGPFRDFLSGILGTAPSPHCTISRERLSTRVTIPLQKEDV
jgi:FkbH-like protein